MEWQTGVVPPLALTADNCARVPMACAVYLVLVLHGDRWWVLYVGKSKRLRSRLREHLPRYGGLWVCWRYVPHNANALYEAECCDFNLYGGLDVLDNRCLPARPRSSRRPRCDALACPVPRRAAWAA